MNLFKRVLEINGRFIPQQWSLFQGWYSKDVNSSYEWLSERSQLTYCSYKTLEEAKNSLKRKIHKV
jgi:hypothetical protein